MRKLILPAVILIFCLGLLSAVVVSLAWYPQWWQAPGGVMGLLIVAAISVLGVVRNGIGLIKDIRDLRAAKQPPTPMYKIEDADVVNISSQPENLGSVDISS